MKIDWLEYLCDPLDGSKLNFAEIVLQQDDRVITGTLVSESGHSYPIRQGIPLFATEGMQSLASVKSFAFEWNEFGFLYAKDGWIQDIVTPLVKGVDFFKDKIIVDAGAGSGAQSRWMAEAGARLVISLELSDAILDRHRETIAGYEEVVFPIQCDIAYPPLCLTPDVVYCINVLQHTATPPKTFSKLAQLVGEESVFLFNVYTKRSELKFRLVRVARWMIRLLPFKVWKWLSFAITTVVHPLSRVPLLSKPIRVFVPISHSFRETWLDIYDFFGGHHYQENMTRTDQRQMIDEAGLIILNEAMFGYVATRQSMNLPENAV